MKNLEIAKLLTENGAQIDQADFLGNTPIDYLETGQKTIKKPVKVPTGNKKYRKLTGPKDESKKLRLQNYKIIKVLGKSTLGNIFLAKSLTTQGICSMKIIKKASLSNKNLLKMVKTEKKILSTISNPFILPLLHSFQTNTKLILVMHYCSRGNLCNLIQSKNFLKTQELKIYACEIILALEYLHDQGYVYRSLVSSNIMIGGDGHLMLADFELATKIKTYGTEEDHSKGLMACIPDEVFSGNYRAEEIDWYMLGLLLYEMATGGSYLAQSTHASIKDSLLQSLVDSLVQVVPCKRLGFEKGAQEVKAHKFFEDVDWEHIYHKNIAIPLPDLSDNATQIVNISVSEDEPCSKDSITDWSFPIN